MPQTQVPVNRTLVGILAIACIAAAAAVALADSLENIWAASFVRCGVLLAAVWLALPSRNREAAWANVSPWTLVGCVIAALLFVRRPREFFVIIAVLVIAAILIRPRRRR